MKFWNNIVNNASLGSAKAPLKTDQLPSYLQDQIKSISTTDTEEEFLILSSLAYQYRLGGHQPFTIQEETIMEAEAETQSYVSQNATSVFKLIQTEELPSLTAQWIHLCESKSLIVETEILPVILDLGIRRKEWRKPIKTIMGKRGEWLIKLNPDWHFYNSQLESEVGWQTGTPEARKEILRDLRTSEPMKAIELLKSTWDAEGANEKVAFLDVLRINLSGDDLTWLQQIKEKGQKVNSMVQDLLKSIPGSHLVESYWTILKNHTRVKTEKALLGMINKTTLEIDKDIQLTEDIYKSGIEKLSSDKNITDQQHILFQLISAVPPSYWNKYLNESTKTIIDLFQKEKQTSLHIQALAQAAIRFNDIQWISDLLNFAKADIIHPITPLMIKVLPASLRNDFAIRFMDSKPPEIIATMSDQSEEWSHDLAKKILKFTSSEVFAYNKTFYRPASALIPISIINELDNIGPTEETKKTYWNNQKEELKRILELKKQVIQSF